MELFFSNRDNQELVHGVQPLRVMIVSEEELFRQKIQAILHGMGGFEVVAATISSQILIELARHRQVDLVILELRTGLDGLDLIKQLKQLPAALHVIVFSSDMHDVTLLQAILTGADGYLMKDTPTRDIIKAFKNFERGGPAMLPAVTTNVIHLLVEHCCRAETPLPGGQRLVPSLSIDLQSPAPSSEGRTLSSFLSPQEKKVFALLRQGWRNKQIATQLAISPYTVGKHVQNILRKLGVVNRTQAAAYNSFEGDNSI